MCACDAWKMLLSGYRLTARSHDGHVMILDYNHATKDFILRVLRGEADVRVLMQEHGLDFSRPASTTGEAVLYTQEPYAAVTFWPHATPAAKEQLSGIQQQIEASRLVTSERTFS